MSTPRFSLEGAWRELGFAARQMLKHPGFASVAVVSLALGLGLNIAMFKVINTLLLQPLDLPNANQLYYVKRVTAQQPSAGHSPAELQELLRRSSDFAHLAVRRTWGFTLAEPHRPAEMVPSGRVSSNFFDVLGVQPELGRNFRADEDVPGRNNVILIAHQFWMSHYGGDPNIVGRKVRLNGEAAEIIGVLPERVEQGMLLQGEQMFRPLGLSADEKKIWTDNLYLLVGRNPDEIPFSRTQAKFEVLAHRLATEFPQQFGGSDLHMAPLQSAATDGGGARAITIMLLGLSGFVLFIACANLGNLMLARAVSRSTEFAVRQALGASRLQVVAPLVAEAFLLSIAGGVGGVLVSIWTNGWMGRNLGAEIPIHFGFDWRVVAFVIGASLLAAVFCCAGPSWLIGRQHLVNQLKSGGRGSDGHASQHRFRQLLITGQFALALVLLAGAAFFVRGMQGVLGKRVGWDAAPLVSGTIPLPTGTYSSPAKLNAFVDESIRRLSALPGVESASAAYQDPIFDFPEIRKYVVEGRPTPVPGREPQGYVDGVTPDYFKSVGTRILNGRAFDEHDRLDSEFVVIIDRDMAQALFPNSDPIGHRIAVADQLPLHWLKIVGVAETVEFEHISPTQIRFQLYQPFAQEPWGYFALNVKMKGAPGSVIEGFRKTIADIDPGVPVLALEAVPDQIRQFNSDLILVQTLVVAFAVLGLFLASLGIYGVVVHLVASRTREIGIRMALGAQASQVVGLVLGSGMRLALIGAAVGLILALGLLKLMANALPGMASDTSLAVAGASVVLIAIALIACLVPAQRAARIDPIVALRQE
ncbi:MAG TPA: ABC transporter permease [Opitutaceae bacterium]|jgi:predicted permease